MTIVRKADAAKEVASQGNSQPFQCRQSTLHRHRWADRDAQVAVYLTYAAPRGHALIDRALYLPKSWDQDSARRERAGVPAAVGFDTKPALATGATNIGAFHEALNMAALWRLPVVFVCQNNRFAEHTALADHQVCDSISQRAIGYGMPGVQVDGNDPSAMYSVAKTAIDRARRGEGPTLIEAMTYRFFGHNFGDPGHYMPKAEREAFIAADPLPALRARLIADHIASEADLAGIEAKIAAEIDDALAFAEASPHPDLAELTRDVYAQEVLV